MKPLYDRVLIPLGVVLAAFAPLACATHWGRAVRVPRNGWWEERGPVVPHDGFPADCTLCHAGDDWHTLRQDFEFDHAQETGVALHGAHEQAECLRCHNDRGPVALFAQKGCSGCHEDIHRGALGADCTQCHGETSWRPEGQIAMHAATRLPLAGAHAALACWVCHDGAEVGNFRGTDPACASCHLDDYQGTTSPNHALENYPLTCQDCHGFVAFDQAAIFTHAGISSGCSDCHLDDYRGTTDPDHELQLFPTTCEQCHTSTTTWHSTNFNHAGISDGCSTCHLPDYQGTSDPRHSAAGFAQTCEQCHTSTSTWDGARYAAHDFPIYSGAHRNRECSACHLTNTNYDAFSCTHCHEHRQSAMDSKHQGRSGYVWESGACLRCHPDGRG